MTITAIKLDPITGEIVYENGRMVVIEGAEAIRQGISLTLKTHTGEMLVDAEHGVDWFGRVINRNWNDPVVRTELQRAILHAPNVISIETYRQDFDENSGRLLVRYSVRTSLGGVEGRELIGV